MTVSGRVSTIFDRQIDGSTSHLEVLLARVSCCRCETCALGKGLLCWLGAGQAPSLAPAKEAVSLAVLGAVLTCGGIALRTSLGNANGGGEAFVEPVMIEVASENVVRGSTTIIGLLARVLRISERSLLIGSASALSHLHCRACGELGAKELTSAALGCHLNFKVSEGRWHKLRNCHVEIQGHITCGERAGHTVEVH
jgi:hypothetical protein